MHKDQMRKYSITESIIQDYGFVARDCIMDSEMPHFLICYEGVRQEIKEKYEPTPNLIPA